MHTRWIDDETVDSQAMLSAYMHYKWKTIGREKEMLDALWTIEHLFGQKTDFGQKVWTGTVMKPCERLECCRCISGMGGYQFRRYDKRWYESYLRMRRCGAWTL